jgi:hypothetical protein
MNTNTKLKAMFSFPSSTATATCQPNKTCRATARAQGSTLNPEQRIAVRGKASTNPGSIKLKFGYTSAQCPGVAAGAIDARAKLNSTGFSPKTRMRVTLRLKATASSHLQVCYRSKSPFKSQFKATAKSGGAGLLLNCAQTGFKPPCVSSIDVLTAPHGQDLEVELMVDPPPPPEEEQGDEVGAARQALSDLTVNYKPQDGQVNHAYPAVSINSSGGRLPIGWSDARAVDSSSSACPTPIPNTNPARPRIWPAGLVFSKPGAGNNLARPRISGTPRSAHTCIARVDAVDSSTPVKRVRIRMTIRVRP